MPGSELYAYAVGRVRAMENRLFGRTTVERLIEAPDAFSCLSILTEAGYPMPEGTGVQAARAYVKSLEQYEVNVVAELKTFVPEPKLFDIFLLKKDYFNIKMLVKSMHKPNADVDLSENGSLTPGKIKKAFVDGDYGELPLNMQKSLPRAIDELVQGRSAQNAELILDRAYFADCYELCDSALRRDTRRFLNEYISMQADLSNIATLLRIRVRQQGENSAQKLFDNAYVQGSLTKAFFTEIMEFDDTKLIQSFASTPYEKIVREGMARYEITRSLSYFEKLCDDYEMNYLAEAGKNIFGIEALFAYYVGKTREILNIRLVMIGKLNDLSNTVIREKVRELRVKK